MKKGGSEKRRISATGRFLLPSLEETSRLSPPRFGLAHLSQFGVLWLAVKYGLTFVHRKARELWGWTSWKLGIAFLASRNYIVSRWGELKPFFFSVLSTFSAEAAVLIIVFPPLEFFLARRNIRENSQLADGIRPVDIVSVMKWSVILCLGLLAVSIWFKEIAHRRSADEED